MTDNHIRNLSISEVDYKNIFNKHAKEYATKEEKKEYKYFNIVLDKSYKIVYNIDECCNESCSERWSYCPICGTDVGRQYKWIKAETLEEVKKIIKDEYSYIENIQDITQYVSFNLIMS